ncbi:MAG: acetoin dehydrogenase dihydrolipoyllysine-residue acetyltransferase subunit [Erythrobacteraceae bacterium]|jgi:pyruvate dehydrogenase E2 component (dihydrolipoamide acetyltransferase)
MADLIPVVMPKWGLAMDEGTVAGWHFTEGDAVQAGAELVDIETSKLLNTLEAKQPGVLLRIVCEEGVVAPCGALIAVLGAADAARPSPEALEAFIAGFTVSGQEEDADPATAAPAFRNATIDGFSLRYAEIGEGEETILFLHGFGGDCGNWMFVQSDLAESCRTIALDLPGHGGSTKALPGSGSLDDLVSLVGAFIAERVLGPVHLVGHSFGGALAQGLAARASASVRSLTLIAPLLSGVSLDRDFLHDLVEARRARELKEVLSRLVADSESISAAMVDDVLKYKRLDGVASVLSNLADMAEQIATATRKMPDVKCVAIWGTKDQIIPPPAAELLSPGSRLELIPACGHMPHLEVPDVVARMIRHSIAAE